MSRSRTKSSAPSIGWLMMVALSPAPALAIGYYNLPGNICQCFGYGVGAGYHAPLVLGPPSMKRSFAHNTQRLWHAPGPPCSYPGNTFVSNDFGGTITEPTKLEPAPAVAPQSLPPPAAAENPAAFRVPYRY